MRSPAYNTPKGKSKSTIILYKEKFFASLRSPCQEYDYSCDDPENKPRHLIIVRDTLDRYCTDTRQDADPDAYSGIYGKILISLHQADGQKDS